MSRDDTKIEPVSLEQRALIDNVLQKVGRNVLLYQQLEGLLKALLSMGSISGKPNELEQLRKDKQRSIAKQTMGGVVQQYVGEILSIEGEGTNTTHNEQEDYISISRTLEVSPKHFTTIQQSLKKLVLERNELIHHFLPSFDPSSSENCINVAKELDAQSKYIRAEIFNTREMVNTLLDSAQTVTSLLKSDAFEELFNQAHPNDPVIQKLVELAESTKSWVLLSVAGSELTMHHGEEFKRLKQSSNHKTLKGIIESNSLFETRYEQTINTQKKVYYRLKK
ncbi:hypothetical protein [Vibrio sp. B1Z05]|uniref:hypothetical protein n=1 Tax=Vibrio sp. B1Z05 TaxID=2654980 RepID=UPI00128DBC41|nr:hypothetical protein [Vibrio sp. B1Z05]MPW35859.1 hypothetical protein [Vibrio sp. B1Z05]